MLLLGIRIALLLEIVILSLYWFNVLKDHLSAPAVVRRLGKSWSRFGAHLPKVLVVLLGFLAAIGVALFVMLMFFDLGPPSSTLKAATIILLLLPVITYFIFVPVKSRIDAVVFRRRLRHLNPAPLPVRLSVSFRSKAIIGWYSALAICFLIPGIGNLKNNSLTGTMFIAASCYVAYWLLVCLIMPDFRLTHQKILVRKRWFEVLPYYKEYTMVKISLTLVDVNLTISENGTVVDTLRLDKMADSQLRGLFAMTGLRDGTKRGHMPETRD